MPSSYQNSHKRATIVSARLRTKSLDAGLYTCSPFNLHHDMKDHTCRLPSITHNMLHNPRNVQGRARTPERMSSQTRCSCIHLTQKHEMLLDAIAGLAAHEVCQFSAATCASYNLMPLEGTPLQLIKPSPNVQLVKA